MEQWSGPLASQPAVSSAVRSEFAAPLVVLRTAVSHPDHYIGLKFFVAGFRVFP
jgi:hypothetical protein